MSSKKHVISREALANGDLRRLVAGMDPTAHLLTDAELEHSLKNSILRRPDTGDVLVFAYGSLLWNPAIKFSSSKPARALGYHRCYSLWTHIGRGSPEQPGLMLGLDRGGSCCGSVLSINEDNIMEELPILWRREMVTAAYRPCWLHVIVEGQRRHALAFIIDRSGPRYASGLSDAEVAQIVTTAKGPLGTCYEYFHETRNALADMDITDHYMERIQRKIMAARDGD